ncbi:MAG TPA: SDR family NAD(P)-dependent oxidoreductase, partial [Trueperaceae bacterium]
MTSGSEQRVALITGGASGIGLACARALMTDGIQVAIVDLDPERGRAVATELDGLFIEADLAQREDCKRAVIETSDAFGRLDILVNNAGFQHIDAIAEFPEDTWDDMLALMLTAPFLLTKYAWPELIRSASGRIINMGSAHSIAASPFKSAYVTAKHGLVGLSRATALEGGPYGL